MLIDTFIYNRVKAYCDTHRPSKEALTEIRNRSLWHNLFKSTQPSYFLVLMPFLMGALCYLGLYTFATLSQLIDPSLDALVHSITLGMGALLWWYAHKRFLQACDACAIALK